MYEKNEETSQRKKRSLLQRLISLVKREPQNTEQLLQLLRKEQYRHILSSEVLGMFERILQVSDMQVREVMIPKAQMVVVRKNDQLDAILPVLTESGHSRFPVVDQTGKEVVGILLAKDLLQYCFNQDITKFNLASMLRPATFTPQSKRLDILLHEFRMNRNHLAIVLDEYGNIAGLVTIEDVLEQIVGEIEDEYDIDEENGHIKKLNDDTFIIKASTPISDFNDYFKANLDTEEFDTIGGIVLKHFEHLPKRGEKLKIGDFRFKVLHGDNRRLYLLELKIVKKKKSE